MAKDAFNKIKEFLTVGLSETLKKRMVKVLAWPVALYGYETWTLRNEEKEKIRNIRNVAVEKIGKGELE